jgi:hypothetical protein
VKWEAYYRLWENRITRQEVLEARAPTRQIAATGGHGHVILNTSTRGKGIRVMLDSGAQGNFILPETIRQLNVPIREKEEPYLLSIIDRTAIK